MEITREVLDAAKERVYTAAVERMPEGFDMEGIENASDFMGAVDKEDISSAARAIAAEANIDSQHVLYPFIVEEMIPGSSKIVLDAFKNWMEKEGEDRQEFLMLMSALGQMHALSITVGAVAMQIAMENTDEEVTP